MKAKVKKEDFLSYEDKYLDFSRKEAKTQKIDAELENKLKETFKKIYNTTFKGALIRCDFFEIDGEIYVNDKADEVGELIFGKIYLAEITDLAEDKLLAKILSE